MKTEHHYNGDFDDDEWDEEDDDIEYDDEPLPDNYYDSGW